MGLRLINLLSLLLFLIGTIWVLMLSPKLVRSFQATYYRAISPFLTAGSTLHTQAHAYLDEVEHSRALQEKLDVVRPELQRLKLIESQYHAIEAENNVLRAALNFKQRASIDVVAAQVIRRQPTTWWQTLEINRGEKAGLATAYPVVTDAGLVGKIDRLGDDYSTVILLTDEACQVSAKVEGTPEVGILQGRREQLDRSPLLRLRFLSTNARLTTGMRVLSTGRGGVFPADLVLGEITQITAGPLSTEAIVKPAVDFQKLVTVFVLAPQKDSS